MHWLHHFLHGATQLCGTKAAAGRETNTKLTELKTKVGGPPVDAQHGSGEVWPLELTVVNK